MKFNGKLFGTIAGFMGLWTGLTFALTAILQHREIDGVWFGIFGALVGVSCATIGMMIRYLHQSQRNRVAEKSIV